MTERPAPASRRWPKRLLWSLVALFVAIQLVPYGRAHSNPPVLAEPAWSSPEARAAFFRSCGDCHSHETRWPWYSQIAPVSWLVQRDVDEGRGHFNVSAWGVQKKNDGDEAAEEVREEAMPLPIYLVTHPEARLTAAEREALARALAATFGEERASD
jgi:hypothetical protein